MHDKDLIAEMLAALNDAARQCDPFHKALVDVCEPAFGPLDLVEADGIEGLSAALAAWIARQIRVNRGEELALIDLIVGAGKPSRVPLTRDRAEALAARFAIQLPGRVTVEIDWPSWRLVVAGYVPAQEP